MPVVKGTDLAPEGQVWVCNACGRRAKSQYGFDENNKSTAVGGSWDSSCITWAVLCYEASIMVENGKVLLEYAAPVDATKPPNTLEVIG